MSSKSKDRFEERISEVDLLQKMIPTPTLKDLTAARRNEESTIHRASLVMLCGHIQGYIEDILEEFVLDLKTKRVVSSKIPAELKVSLCKSPLLMLNNDDRNVLIERIPDFIRRYETIWCSDKELSPEDFPEFIKRDWETGNPWPNTVDAFLKRIGIKCFWSEENRVIKGDLDNLVTKRNLIAHGHLYATATNEDVARYIDSAKLMVELLDTTIQDHLNEIAHK